MEWLSAFVQAHARVFNSYNIAGGFRGAGIFPHDPGKVRRRIAQPSPSPLNETRESTPQLHNPFNSAVLMSSPNDSYAVNIANTALIAEANSGHPLTTPARNYLGCLVRTSDRRRVSNTIYQKENTHMREALGRRRVVKSGRRNVVHGKNLMTTPEMCQALEEVDRNKKKRQVAQPKKGKRKTKARNEVLSEESEGHWSEEISEEAEVLDCIEVEV